MPNILTITVDDSANLLNAGAYGAGAVIRVQTSATEAGVYGDLSGTGSTPTIAIVSGTSSYTGYDPSGTATSWYRTRYENSGATRVSDWTTAFQAGGSSAGYSNLQLLRRMVGDPGDAAHDYFSGNGSSTIFYLTQTPLTANGQGVFVGGVLKAELTDYTLDDASGRLVFGSAPASGTDNILVDYTSVRATDTDLDEALRLYGLAPGATADTGPATAMVRAAIEVCDWTARRYSDAADIETDGQSIKRSQIAAAFAARAKELRAALAAERVGISPIKILRQDGYNAAQQVTSDEVSTTGANPRMKYFGTPDRRW